jgi:hypothetical protein
LNLLYLTVTQPEFFANPAAFQTAPDISRNSEIQQSRVEALDIT